MKYRLIIISFSLITHIMAYCQINQGVLIGNQLSTYKTSEDSCSNVIISRKDINNDTELLVDSASNAFYIVDIIGSSNNRFLVNIMSSDTDSQPLSMDSVWISKSNVGVGLTTTRINNEPKIPLYNKPSYSSSYSILPTDAAYNIVQVLECDGKWLKIRFCNKGKEMIGWIAPENQCINMYSMCSGN